MDVYVWHSIKNAYTIFYNETVILSILSGEIYWLSQYSYNPGNTNVERQWSNIKSTLDQCLVFVGKLLQPTDESGRSPSTGSMWRCPNIQTVVDTVTMFPMGLCYITPKQAHNNMKTQIKDADPILFLFPWSDLWHLPPQAFVFHWANNVRSESDCSQTALRPIIFNPRLVWDWCHITTW